MNEKTKAIIIIIIIIVIIIIIIIIILNKARFRRQTFHEPNLIRIKTDPHIYLDRLN